MEVLFASRKGLTPAHTSWINCEGWSRIYDTIRATINALGLKCVYISVGVCNFCAVIDSRLLRLMHNMRNNVRNESFTLKSTVWTTKPIQRIDLYRVREILSPVRILCCRMGFNAIHILVVNNLLFMTMYIMCM